MIDLTPVEVRKKKGDFRRTMRGYEPALVDDFLDQVADRMDELVRENMALSDRAVRQEQQIGEFRERERALTEALVTAQEMREEIRQQTSREAELMKKSAEQHAAQLRSTTMTELAQLRAAAEQEAAQLRAAAQEEAARVRGLAEREANELSTTVRQQREREEEELRRLRIRQEQFLGSYRALLERELEELSVRAQAIVQANQGSSALDRGVESPPRREPGGGADAFRGAAAPAAAWSEAARATSGGARTGQPTPPAADAVDAGALAAGASALVAGGGALTAGAALAGAGADVPDAGPAAAPDAGRAAGAFEEDGPAESEEPASAGGRDSDATVGETTLDGSSGLEEPTADDAGAAGYEAADLAENALAAEPFGLELGIETIAAPVPEPTLADVADEGYVADPDQQAGADTGLAPDDSHWLPRDDADAALDLSMPELDEFVGFEAEPLEPFAPEPFDPDEVGEPGEPGPHVGEAATVDALHREIESLSAAPSDSSQWSEAAAAGDAGALDAPDEVDAVGATDVLGTMPAPGGTELYDGIAHDASDDGVPGPIGLSAGGDADVDEAVDDVFGESGDAADEDDESTSLLLRNAAAAGYQLPEDDELLLDDILEEDPALAEAEDDDGWLPNLLEDEK